MRTKHVYSLVGSLIMALAMLADALPCHSKATAIGNVEDRQIWVATDGNDNNDGTSSSPFATLQKALSYARELRHANANALSYDIHIIMKEGTYQFDKTLVLTNADNGRPMSRTIIEAQAGKEVVLSGGVPIREWQEAGTVEGLPAIAQGHIWKTAAPSIDGRKLAFRQMWVGDNKMRRASSLDDLSLPRLISVNKSKKELTVPRIKQVFSHPDQLEMTIIQDWTTNIMRVKSVVSAGERSVLTFCDPESSIEFKRPWPILRADEQSFSNHMFYLSNAIELLDRPQEWFCDTTSANLFYWPKSGEQPETLEAIVPAIETIIDIEGDDKKKVENISFNGITFAHSSWLRPSQQGHVPLQAGQWLYDAYTDETSRAGNVAWVGRPGAAVRINNARGITFEDCNFKQTASTGLDLVSGAKQITVRGCTFNDIGGSAILAGFFGDKTFEAHEPYLPEDANVVCDSITIDNNYIAHVATEDWGCLGICIGFASNVTISHNEIYDTPYSAISMGWGWTEEPNCMHDNHIIANYLHHFCNQMRDGGAIYTLSSQKGSTIEGNRIEDVGDPKLNPLMWDIRHAQFDIYLDEGSDYFTVRDNWCERGEINKNKNGSHNICGVNSSAVSESVKKTAGLESAYKYLPLRVHNPDMAPVDSIGDDNSNKDRIEYIAQSEGFKLGNALAVDLNDDNRLDIVYGGGESNQVQHGGVRINTGNYGFAATQGLKRVYMSNFAAGDLDGDGHIDLIQAGWDFWDSYNAMWLNDGKGHLTEHRLSSSDTSPACGIADVNNDGRTDFFFVGNGTNNSFYLQQEDHTFAPAISLLALPGGFSDPNMVYADFNNDQTVDIALLSNKTGGVFTRIFFNDGQGNFTEKAVGLTERGTRGSMAFADVNGDGWLDLVVGGTYAGEQWNSTAADGGKVVTLYLNDGKGCFKKQQDFSEYMFDNVTQSVRFCDWNNDGYTDIAVSGWNMSQGNMSRTNIYLNDGYGNFSLSDTDLPGVSESSLELADFSGFGRNDILISGNCNTHYQNFVGDRRIAVLCRNKTEKTNTVPTPPANLKTIIDEGGTVRMIWDAGQDMETPTPSLSYNYYLRELTTGRYLTFPNADIQTGFRRVSQIGNAYLNKGWTLRGLSPGVYAWSVQTIDAAYAGSAFAPEQTFVITEKTSIPVITNNGNAMRISVDKNTLRIETDLAQPISINKADGSIVLTKQLHQGVNTIRLPSNLYIINNHKFIVQ